MKSRKRIWIAALCLLSATVVTISLKARSASIQAATPAHVSRAMSIQPVAHLTDAALRAVSVRNAMMWDDDGPIRVTASQQSNQIIFPQVEQYTLIPPNPAQGISKTILSVRFAESAAEHLPTQIPMKLAGQSVVLQRSPVNPSSFVTSFDFNWQRFAQEQAQRKEGASQGMMVPVFDGRRFLRSERMQFVEPSEIQNALQSHQPLQFSPGVLTGSTLPVFPDHQLMMNSLAVVQDNGTIEVGAVPRTFYQCLPQGQQQGSSTGAWTFNTLMLAIAGITAGSGQSSQPAEQMLLNMLNSFNQQQQNQNTNGFKVYPRPAMGQLNIPAVGQAGAGLLGNWPIDNTLQNPDTACTGLTGPTACPSLANAPVRLDAIVNRIDLGANGSPFPPAGELRFVFTVATGLFTQGQQQANPCESAPPMNIILEYNIPSNITALEWAEQWAALPNLNSTGTFVETYLVNLNLITNQVVLPNLCTDNGNPISCIAQVRTNEILLSSGVNINIWEQREFHFSNTEGNNPTLFEATIAQTPDPQFNTTGRPPCGTVNDPNGPPGPCDTTGAFATYINDFAFIPVFTETNGAAPPVTNDFPPGSPFLGASALNPVNGGLAFWDENGIDPSGQNPQVFEAARIDFSTNTCNGCHGTETATGFQHVVARAINSVSGLSNFLLGCSDGTCRNGGSQCIMSCPNGDNQCALLLLEPNGPCLGTESVQDPNQSFPNTFTQFGDIERRIGYLQTVCGNNCEGGSGSDLLLPFTNKPLGVH